MSLDYKILKTNINNNNYEYLNNPILSDNMIINNIGSDVKYSFICSNNNKLVLYGKVNTNDYGFKIINKNDYDYCLLIPNDKVNNFVPMKNSNNFWDVYITDDDILLFLAIYNNNCKLFIYNLSCLQSEGFVETVYTENNPTIDKPTKTVRLLKTIDVNYVADSIDGSKNQINLICTDGSLILECSYQNKKKVVVLET